jgi:hypothetical protein
MKIITNISGALLLGLALCLVLINCASPAYIFWPSDPVFSMSLRRLFWMTSGLTLAVSLVCLFDDRPSRQMYLLSALGSIFVGYQTLIYWRSPGGLSGYLGGFSRTFGIPAQSVATFVAIFSGCLLIGSCVSLGWLRRVARLEENFLKMSCPSCGGHLKFSARNLGDKIPCPHCKSVLTLRKTEENLRMSCFFCTGHIAFPSHAIGSKIQCPHCRKDITLQQSTASV